MSETGRKWWTTAGQELNPSRVTSLKHRKVMAGLLTEALHHRGWNERHRGWNERHRG